MGFRISIMNKKRNPKDIIDPRNKKIFEHVRDLTCSSLQLHHEFFKKKYTNQKSAMSRQITMTLLYVHDLLDKMAITYYSDCTERTFYRFIESSKTMMSRRDLLQYKEFNKKYIEVERELLDSDIYKSVKK